MSKLSEQVQNQIKGSEKVVASARTHAPKVAVALAERAARALGTDTRLTAEAAATVVTSLADLLSHAADDLRARELAYTAEQADDGPVRAARDATTQEVATLMTRLRSTVESALGREALSPYGLQGDTPRAPRKLLNHVGNVVQLMKRTPAHVTTPFGASFNTQAAVPALEAKHAELAGHIQDDDREARELEDAMTERDRATAAWSDAYQSVATTLEGIYRLAGWRELADRMRPTQRTLRGEEAGQDIAGQDIDESTSATDAPPPAAPTDTAPGKSHLPSNP